MKTMKKIISLTMSVIMLITASPVLQAAEFADLNRAQMAEFQKEILQNVKLDLNKAKDPVKELIALHAGSQKDLKEIAQILIERIKDIDPKMLKEVAIQLLQLKAEAIKAAATDKRYSKISDKKEREQMAFFTRLSWSNLDDNPLFNFGVKWLGFTISVCGLTFLIGKILIKCGAELLGEVFCEQSIVALVGVGYLAALTTFLGVIAWLFTAAYTPTLSPSLSEEETFEIFSKKPFDIIAEFDEPDFYLMYGKGPKCAQILSDVVYIKHRIAKKGYENIDLNTGKEIMYLKTIDWYEMTPEERAAYLHQFAERLRAESKAKTNKYSKKVGLEER